MNVVECLSISDKRLNDVLQEPNRDLDMTMLRDYTGGAWPETKSEVPAGIRAFCVELPR